MIKKTKLIPLALAVAGIISVMSFLASSNKEKPIALPITEPSTVPYENYIGGSGLTEPNSENISIGTHIPGIVKEIYVSVGDNIKKNAPLFLIENREATARLAQAEALVKQRSAELQNMQDQWQIIANIKDKRAISQDERNQRLRAVEIAKATLEAAKADAQVMRTDLTLHTVLSPIDGVVMTMNMRLGEYIATNNSGDALIQIGNLNPMHLRVDIDENDAWRFEQKHKAIAFLRGNPEITAPLEFVRVEPFVRPKTSLTGESSERVDTRVLQIIYRFDPSGKPIYAGQQMDIYIESTPIAEPAPAEKPNAK